MVLLFLCGRGTYDAGGKRRKHRGKLTAATTSRNAETYYIGRIA